MGTIAAYRSLAGNRNLVRLFIGEFVSGIGDWLYLVALLVIVYRESSDPFLLGVVGGARILPYILLSVPAGMIIDRFDRRLILIVTDIARGLVMVGLALAAFLDGPVLLIVGLAILATVFAVFFQPTVGSYLPSLTRNEEELGPANSLFSALGEISFIIGPAIGGVIIATTNLGLAFAINAVTFVVVAVVLWTLPPNRPRAIAAEAAAAAAAEADDPAEGPEATRKRAAEAVTFRSILRPLSGVATLDLVAGFMYGGLSVVLVILAVDRLGAGEEATGYMWAAIGVGGVLGAVVSGTLVMRPNLAPAMVGGSAVLGVGFIALGFADALVLALGALAFTAVGALVSEVAMTTLTQRIVPDAIRGRTLGGLQTIETLTYALGSFLMPLLLVAFGAQLLFPVGGVAIIGASLVALLLVGHHFQRAPDPAGDTLRRVSRLPLFAGVSPAALEVAASRLQPVPVPAGTAVIREGEPADRFYIVSSGRFAVDQRDPGTRVDRRLREMGPDEVFGELGLMNRAPRSATVTAVTDGELLALEGEHFLELLSAEPEISGRMMARYGGGTAVR